MCRSQSEGGRRCSSTRSAGGGGGTVTAIRPKTSKTSKGGRKGTVSYEDAVRLVSSPDSESDIRARNQTPGFAALNRGPMNERSRRFYTLRDRGWTGPIDQDGNPVPGGDLIKRPRR